MPSICVIIILKSNTGTHTSNLLTSSLLNGSPDVKLTYHYILSGKYDEEKEQISKTVSKH